MLLIAVSLKTIILNYINSASRYANSFEKCRGTLLMVKLNIEKGCINVKSVINCCFIKIFQIN